MNENIIKSPLLPDTIHFNHTMENQTEVMRITRDGVWVNPDMAVDETAKAVLDALDSQVKVLVQRAVGDEREACAKVAESYEPTCDLCPRGVANAIRSRGIDGAKVGEVGVWGDSQALAEPANSTTDFVEPVAWVEMDKDYLAVSADPFENAIPVYTTPPKKEWVGLTVNEARDFYEKYADREELIYAIDKFLEEKNT